jgi:SAM-dependent methyltransferase
MQARERKVEQLVRDVYNYCPPTETHYHGDGRRQYEQVWGSFLESIGVPPVAFRGRRVLDVGCGSCEKAAFYADWGGRVTGLEMTPEVLARGRSIVAGRDVTLINTSLFDFTTADRFDIVISDGVLHHTADTHDALRRCASFVAPGGVLIIGLVNVWGTFWWFKPARGIVRLLGGGSVHRRAAWGRRLFRWTRKGQEATGAESDVFFRAEQSWEYDWFANPRWNAHRPGTVRRWLEELGFEHVGSVPPLARKDHPTTRLGRIVRSMTGRGAAGMSLYWLVTRRPNMFYCAATRPAHGPQILPSCVDDSRL